jgi:hypothetical protein
MKYRPNMYVGMIVAVCVLILLFFVFPWINKEAFDDSQCDTVGDPLDLSMQSTLGQIKQQHKEMCQYMLSNYKTLYPAKGNRLAVTAIDQFIATFHWRTSPTKQPSALIYFLASWNGWRAKMNECDQSIAIPVIFCNILFDLYFMDYETMTKNYNYMIKTQDDYLRIKRIYMNAYNLKNQYDPAYRGDPCNKHRINMMRPLWTALNADVQYFTNSVKPYPKSTVSIVNVQKFLPKKTNRCRGFNAGVRCFFGM